MRKASSIVDEIIGFVIQEVKPMSLLKEDTLLIRSLVRIKGTAAHLKVFERIIDRLMKANKRIEELEKQLKEYQNESSVQPDV